MLILNAMIVMTLMGFLAGALLAVAKRFFYVVEDPRFEAVRAILPGGNCGACGFAGCDGAARAIVSGKAPVHACSMGGFDIMRQVAGILGHKSTYAEPVTAVSRCTGGRRAENRYFYKGAADCRAEQLFYGGAKTCDMGCLGNGSCVRACRFGAIHINGDGFPEIDRNKCLGCGKCVAVCPRGVLSLTGFTEQLLSLNKTEDCLAPCRQKCPAQVNVPQVIRYIRQKDYKGALLKIKERNPLVLSVGRVCGHPCEHICRRNISDQGVAICHLQRFVGEWELNSRKRVPVKCAPDTGHGIAVVGGGPAGLSCAYFLRRLGHRPTIFEKKSDLGGMLRYGITEYRLPMRLVEWDIGGIIDLGITVETKMELGKDFTLADLKSLGYEAVFLGLGAWIVPSLCIDGEYAEGVMTSLDFLSRIGTTINDLTGAHVVVIGESNTAMDCARSSIRLGAESVTVICPVDRKEMSARKNDVTRAVEEGVALHCLSIPVKIISGPEGAASRLAYCHVEPGDKQQGTIGKRIPGSERTICATLVISAYERKPDMDCLLHDRENRYQFKASPKWTLEADETTQLASKPDVFAAGDMHTGRASVISAVAGGRKAARSIHFLLTQGTLPASKHLQKRINPRCILRKVPVSEHIPKVTVQELPVSLRKTSFIEEVQGTISQKQALLEARRCLRCGTFCNDQ